MKVITEERLREWQNTNGVYKELFQKLIEECQELDTLTVTRLRPMSEIYSDHDRRYKQYLVKIKSLNCLKEASIRTDGCIVADSRVFYSDECDGFIPMPRYEPEKV